METMEAMVCIACACGWYIHVRLGFDQNSHSPYEMSTSGTRSALHWRRRSLSCGQGVSTCGTWGCSCPWFKLQNDLAISYSHYLKVMMNRSCFGGLVFLTAFTSLVMSKRTSTDWTANECRIPINGGNQEKKKSPNSNPSTTTQHIKLKVISDHRHHWLKA